MDVSCHTHALGSTGSLNESSLVDTYSIATIDILKVEVTVTS